MMAGFGPLWALVGPRFLPVDSTDWDSTFTRSRALRPVQEQTGGALKRETGWVRPEPPVI